MLIILDEITLAPISGVTIGTINQLIVTIALLGSIWGMSDSFPDFMNTLQAKKESIINLSLIFSIFVNIVGLVASRTLFRLSLPVESISDLDLKEIWTLNQDEEQGGVKYAPSIGTFVLVIAIFLIGYFLVKETLASAFKIALLTILPFSIAFLVTMVTKVFIELIILLMRFLIHSE